MSRLSSNVELVILAGSQKSQARGELEAWPPAHLRPLDNQRVIADCWELVSHRSAGAHGFKLAPINWLLVSRGLATAGGVGRPYVSSNETCLTRFEFEDIAENRGSAGILGDWSNATLEQMEAEWVLAVDATASPAVDLGAMFQRAKCNVACVLGQSELGRYCGCMLIQRKWLDLIPRVGFFDLKEQFLAQTAANGGRLVNAIVASRSLNVACRSSWLETVARWNSFSRTNGFAIAPNDFGAARQVGDCIVQTGAIVQGAALKSSVVLEGAVVKPGAVIARSIIGPGVVIPSCGVVIDRIATEKQSSQRGEKERSNGH